MSNIGKRKTNKRTLYTKILDFLIQNTAYIYGVREEPEPVTIIIPKMNKSSNIGIKQYFFLLIKKLINSFKILYI